VSISATNPSSFVKKIGWLFLFISNLSVGQEKILEFNVNHVGSSFQIENSFTMVDESSNDFTIFMTKNSDIAAFHYSSNFETKGGLVSTQLPNKFKIPLGGIIDDNKYTLFFANKIKDQFSGITFDFEKRWSNVFELDFKLKKEIYLTNFVFENKLYILAASYRTNHLFLYSFESNGNYNKETIDLTQYDLYGVAEYPTRLKSTIGLDIPNRAITNIFWVQKDVPYSLDSMVSLIKLYVQDNKMYLVSDLNRSFTQIISYNLKDTTVDYKKIKYPTLDKDAMVNSFMLKDKLFQFKINSDEMVLTINDIPSELVLKEYFIKKGDSLFLGNNIIKQRGGRYKKYREFEKTSQFLRKVGTSHPAIHVDRNESGYNFYLGSVEEIENSALEALAFVNPFVPFVAMGSLTLYFNPVAIAFYRSSNTRAVYITQSTNDEFELIPETPEDNIFYRINDFLESEDIKRYKAADVFPYEDSYIFGMLDKKTNTYSLREFK
jgi:hypothetical protein